MIKEVFQKKIKNSFSEVLLDWRVKLMARSEECLEKGEKEKSSEYEEIIEGIMSELKRRLSDKSVDDNRSGGLPEIGVMASMGYHVGVTQGKKPRIRRRILDDIYSGPIVMVGSLEHMDEWGEDCSTKRLKKLKRNLKSFITSNKNRKFLETAVKEWQEDLEYLEKEY